MDSDHLGNETLALLEKYRRQFGGDIDLLYGLFSDEQELQAGIRHALRCGRPIPVRVE